MPPVLDGPTCKPRHPLAGWLAAQGILSRIEKFSELEDWLAGLATPQQRGLAFEAFAEAWLATQRLPQARTIWPGQLVPPSIVNELRLSHRDMGIDGVFQTVAEEFVCYQVKFRSGRPTITWTDLSKFFGQADTGCGRLVFSNSDDFSGIAADRPGVVFVRGLDLDRLTAVDFREMEAWLSGAVIVREQKQPRPHQATAIDDILSTFAREDRATALMACGSGKTLIALWVAERVQANTILVLLPSLALVGQTLHEWLMETRWRREEMEYQCVCSDATVIGEEDSMIVRQSEVDFPVTTDSEAVRRFLKKSTARVRIVFSTYQSSPVVAAGMKGLPPFDFGVFDEAHKTAGRDGAKFSFALTDERLPIKKRLFLTATPRHYELRNRADEAAVVFSMDSREVYGRVAHRLPFSRAAELGVVTFYKVIISVVTSEMVNDELLRRGIVLVGGEEIKARQVANQLALQSAIKKYDVRKVFTFHSKVAAAKSFVSDGAEGVATHLPAFHCAHINGGMPMAHRKRIMREFESMPRGVLSNARCLTEGVDVPAVDMVAFLSPRRSLVDIVQATGRAIRCVEGKEFGYVLVPLFVELARGETIEEAVSRSDFDEVWNVLNQLQEHDDLLAQTIAEMRAQRGRTGGFDDFRFRERVEVMGPSVSLENLRNAITAACLDAVGDSWFERYGQLEAYNAEHGNCDIPARYPQNKRLGVWVVTQRVLRNDGHLADDKIILLDRIGFTWNPKARTWRNHYLALIAYRDRFGNCRVPQSWKENEKLAQWVSTQRLRRKRGQLTAEKIAILDRVGFEWEIDSRTWHHRVEEVRQFKLKHGNTLIPARWRENPTLGSWVATQRYERRQGRLDAEQIAALDEVGFEWEVAASRKHHNDDERIEALKGFHSEHGHFAISKGDKSLSYLSSWMTLVRRQRKLGTLAPELEGRLDELGFTWKPAPAPNANQCEQKIAHFRDWASKLGGLNNVPANDDTRTLRRWMTDIRNARKLGKLSAGQIAAIDSLGFKWSTREVSRPTNRPAHPRETKEPTRSWEQMLGVLADFFRIHGHCNVPGEWPADQELAWWVWTQRSARRGGELTADQIRLLEDMGFSWSSYEAGWDEMLNRFLAARRVHQRTGGKRKRLPLALQRWVVTQRQSRRLGRLSPERIEKLDAANFEWSPLAKQWDVMFSQLESYRARYNHCRVPLAWSENPQLGHWVGVQRRDYKTSRLPEDRVARLKSIGFEWSVRSVSVHSTSQSRTEMLAQLSHFHGEYGHSRVPQKYANNTKLGWWVTTQRRQRRKGKLSREQIAELDALNFEWQPGGLQVKRAERINTGLSAAEYWEKMFKALQDYRDAYGDCRVPQKWAQNRSLGGWVGDQRLAWKHGQLDEEKTRRLNEIEFDWDPLMNRWEEMFEQLLRFRERHGHCNVPQRHPQYAALATWVRNQRNDWKIKRPIMVNERAKRLEEIGFSWSLKALNAWESMLDELIAFKKAHGHCNVPQKWPENRVLGKWVNTQRTFFKRGTLSSDRRKQLDDIGFIWVGKLPRIPSPRDAVISSGR